MRTSSQVRARAPSTANGKVESDTFLILALARSRVTCKPRYGNGYAWEYFVIAPGASVVGQGLAILLHALFRKVTGRPPLGEDDDAEDVGTASQVPFAGEALAISPQHSMDGKNGGEGAAEKQKSDAARERIPDGDNGNVRDLSCFLSLLLPTP